MSDRAYTRQERLTRSRDFAGFHELRPAALSKDFLVKVRPAPEGRLRLGVIASRRVGGAVTRNRARRIVREVFRLNKDRLALRHGPSDVLIIVRPRNEPARAFDYASAERQLARLWR